MWENACGEGHLSDRLKELGYEVATSDIIDRNGCVDQIIDFLSFNGNWHGDILTNPPYKYAQGWVEKSMKVLRKNSKLYLFLKLTFLEGQKRRKMFEKYPPKYVYVFSKRIQVAINGDPEMFKKSSAAAYAWFVWQKGFNGNPIIKWI
ncbi:MAG TPA: NAD(P)-dependent oxidoreductase [Candidatus Moranbacteria bacterium]|nr:NAD(P)-dependent oxidoreductase [Candidatus Moranbacteria bacterium]